MQKMTKDDIKKEKFKKLPGVMSCDRCFINTDAVLLNKLTEGTYPVEVLRHGLRGTQNKVDWKDESPMNIQETETAMLSHDSEGLIINYEMKFLQMNKFISQCNAGKFELMEDIKRHKDSILNFIDRCTDSKGLEEVSRRYARNIVNARWTWRNRTFADSVTVTTSFNDQVLIFNSTDIPFDTFNDYSEDEKILAKHIENCMTGVSSAGIQVSADIGFGIRGALEVYPSQNKLPDRAPKGFSRSLYKYNTKQPKDFKDNNVVGFAAITSRKIGNALRTIDTWYKDFDGKAIPVEPNGANLDDCVFYRKDETSAFNYFLNLNNIDPSSNEGMFSIASIMRGGVYSGGPAEDPNADVKKANLDARKKKKAEDDAILKKAKEESKEESK